VIKAGPESARKPNGKKIAYYIDMLHPPSYKERKMKKKRQISFSDLTD